MSSYNPDCVRRTSNWSLIHKEHKFDKSTFHAETLLKDMEKQSPKLVSLIQNIKDLDALDMEKHGRLFKHFIFSEVKQGGYGVKIVAGALLASGYTLAYDSKISLLSDDELLKNAYKNILLLSSTPVFNETVTVKAKKAILAKFNERPGNIHGELARIILLDSGFKEGIDLFDVNYVHIFEPQTSKADQKQVIGRATRLCGQKGLDFHPTQGWPLNVFLYDVSVPDELKSIYDTQSLFKLYLNSAGIDMHKLEFTDELEKYTIIAAADYELNKNVHNFRIEEEEDYRIDFSGGGRGDGLKGEVQCNKTCGARPNGDVPVTLPLFSAVFLGMDRSLPKFKKHKNGIPPRAFYCNVLKWDPAFCAQVKKAWRDPIAYVKAHKKAIYKAISDKRHLNLPRAPRHSFLRFVYQIIPLQIKKVPKPRQPKQPRQQRQQRIEIGSMVNEPPSSSRESFMVESAFSKPSVQTAVPMSITYDDYFKPPLKIMNFIEVRQHVRENFLHYSWPKVVLENLCLSRGGGAGASEVVSFTPTQNFVRHYFTPQSAYKGILLYQSVGTGKTCSAISTATSTFEKEGYTILWVTRTTLKHDIFKNMFDQVCNLVIQEKIKQGVKIPADHSARMALLSKSWKIRPMSYKQFSNLVQGKNQLHKDLVEINGKHDPLRKTLLIIDEAHKLYGGNDLAAVERPNMNKLKDAIMKSYAVSGVDSVKIMMMTATPITNDPMELIKLLNLMRPVEDQMPTEYNKFAAHFMVNSDGKFTTAGWRKYMDSIAGYISYLSREKDARQFSQPHIVNIVSPMSVPNLEQGKDYAALIQAKNKDIENLAGDVKAFKASIAAAKKDKTCIGECNSNMMNQLAEKSGAQVSETLKLKEEIKMLKKERIVAAQEERDDVSQQSILREKCLKQKRTKKTKQSS